MRLKVEDLWYSKIGKLEIDVDSLRDLDLKAAKKLNKKIVVLNAEHNFISNKIIYTAISNEFDKIEKGEIHPIYHVEVTKFEIEKDNFDYEIKFVRESEWLDARLLFESGQRVA